MKKTQKAFLILSIIFFAISTAAFLFQTIIGIEFIITCLTPVEPGDSTVDTHALSLALSYVVYLIFYIIGLAIYLVTLIFTIIALVKKVKFGLIATILDGTYILITTAILIILYTLV